MGATLFASVCARIPGVGTKVGTGVGTIVGAGEGAGVGVSVRAGFKF